MTTKLDKMLIYIVLLLAEVLMPVSAASYCYYYSYYYYCYYYYYYNYYSSYSTYTSGGVIAGIVIGSLAGVALFIGLIVFCCIVVCKSAASSGTRVTNVRPNPATVTVVGTATQPMPMTNQPYYQSPPGYMPPPQMNPQAMYPQPMSSNNIHPPPVYAETVVSGSAPISNVQKQ